MSDEIDHTFEVTELLQAARSLETSPTKVSLLEEAVRRADLTGDEELAYRARQQLIETANFCGRSDLGLVAFIWCLGHADRNPERYDWSSLLWRYKWIIASLSDFPQVSRGQIEAAMHDMEQRIVREGYSLYAIELLRRSLANKTGDFAGARAAHERFIKMKRDGLSDCLACVDNKTVSYHVYQGEPELAVKAAARIRAGHMNCAHVPHGTYPTLLMPLFDLDRLDEAMECYRLGYNLINRSSAFTEEMGEMLIFLAMTDNIGKGLQTLGSQLPRHWQAYELRPRLEFLFGVILILLAAQKAGKTTAKLRMPATFELAQPGGEYSISDLLSTIREAATDLALQFDQRNENHYFSDRLAVLPELLARAKPNPYPSARRKKKSDDEE